jgi:multiple sugar transport system substrate-binding protein
MDGMWRRRLHARTRLVTGFAVLALTISACGSTATSPASNGGGDVESPEAGNGTEEITLSFWKGPHSEREAEIWGAVFDGFTEENPGITVEHTIVPWETADQQYAAAFAGGDPPDIAYLPDQFMVGFADRGQLADLGPYIESTGYDTDVWYEGAWSLGNYEGVQYAVPYAGGAYIIYYNKTMWDELGLGDPPSTWDELMEYAEAGTAGETWGFLAPSSAADSSYFQWFSFFHDRGANFMNEDHTANGFNNEGGLEALTFATDMFCTNKVTPPAGQYTLPELVDLFIGGNALMLFEGMNSIPRVADEADFEWDVFMPPTETTGGNQGQFAIAEQSENQEAAFRLIEYITSPDVLGPIISQSTFRPLRSDMEDLYSDDPVKNKVLEMTTDRVRAYEGQLHPDLREVLTGLWTEFEGALACSVEPEAALQSAADRVDAILSE